MAGAWGQSVPGVQLGTGLEKAFPLVVCVQGTLGIEPSWKTRDCGTGLAPGKRMLVPRREFSGEEAPEQGQVSSQIPAVVWGGREGLL